MKKLIFTSLLYLIAFNNISYSQNEELFKGENLLDTCKLNIPLTYKKKDMKVCAITGNEYKDKEIILLRYDIEKNELSYSPCYIVVDDKFIYFETPEMHASTSLERKAIFLNYNPNKQRFYDAACFKNILEQNIELKSIITLSEKL